MWVRRTVDKVSLLTVGNITYSGDPRIKVMFIYPNNWRLSVTNFFYTNIATELKLLVGSECCEAWCWAVVNDLWYTRHFLFEISRYRVYRVHRVFKLLNYFKVMYLEYLRLFETEILIV